MPVQKAKEILKKYWDGILPVRPEKIARDIGIEVSGENHPSLSGELCETEIGPKIIFNAQESPLRQRFTIAHELGHFVLNHGARYRDPAEHFSSEHYDLKEVHANQFAAELLIPEEAVKYCLEDGIANTVAGLARAFAVSEVAMSIRLKNLGYLSGN